MEFHFHSRRRQSALLTLLPDSCFGRAKLDELKYISYSTCFVIEIVYNCLLTFCGLCQSHPLVEFCFHLELSAFASVRPGLWCCVSVTHSLSLSVTVSVRLSQSLTVSESVSVCLCFCFCSLLHPSMNV